MDPLNYTIAAPNPVAGALQGYAQGVGISDLQNQQAAQQRAIAQQQQQAQVIQSLVSNKNATADDYANAQLLVPQLAEQLGKSWSTKNTAQQNAQLSDLSQWGAAIQNGQPNIAVDAMKSRADAMENTAGAPTPESQALRAQADAIAAHPEFGGFMIKSLLAAHPDGKKVIDNIVSLGKEGREAELAPSVLRASNAKAGEAEADAATAEQSLVARTLGSLEGKGAKIAQVETALRSLYKRGALSKEDLADALTEIPVDAKERDAWLGQKRLSGVKADDQTKLITPDANSRLSADTQIKTAGMNNSTQLAVQDRIDSRQKEMAQFKVEHGTAGLTDAQNEALYGENGAVTLGKLDPNKINGKTARLYADAVIKNPNIDFGKLSAGINASRKADADFTTGKNGNTVRSFNVGLSHLDTLDQLATALQNKNTQLFNKIGNAYASQTGDPAPTSFNAARKVVGDELVKAIVGAGGGVSDREEIANTLNAANSPAQLKAVIKNYKELMVGQLGGLQKQYTAATGRDDFDKYLSAEAVKVRNEHSPKKPAAAAKGGVVNFSDLR